MLRAPLVRCLLSALVFAVGLFFGARSASAAVGECEEIESRDTAPVVVACLALLDAGSDFDALPGFCTPYGTSDIAPPPMAPHHDGGVISACDDDGPVDGAGLGGPVPTAPLPDAHPAKALLPSLLLPMPALASREVSFAPPPDAPRDGVRGRVDRPPTR